MPSAALDATDGTPRDAQTDAEADAEADAERSARCH
jgi:hypothetical protein